jgi:hypothetical protein
MPKCYSKIKNTWTALGHSVNCKEYGPFLDIQQHSFNIFRFFVCENPYTECTLADWFHLASGIKSVDYTSDLFDSSSAWCRPAYEYEFEKSKFHSKLITELTRFTFIWGGFEAFVDTLNLSACPTKRGKFNAVNYFLTIHYSNKKNPIKFYSELLDYFKKIITKNPWYGDVNELFAIDNCVSETFIGLKVVYKIRNLFAHGAFKFSEPQEWNIVKPFDIQIISVSSRIVLLTIQLLILSTSKNLKFNVYQPDETFDIGCVASNFVKISHLKKLERKNFKSD